MQFIPILIPKYCLGVVTERVNLLIWVSLIELELVICLCSVLSSYPLWLYSVPRALPFLYLTSFPQHTHSLSSLLVFISLSVSCPCHDSKEPGVLFHSLFPSLASLFSPPSVFLGGCHLTKRRKLLVSVYQVPIDQFESLIIPYQQRRLSRLSQRLCRKSFLSKA